MLFERKRENVPATTAISSEQKPSGDVSHQSCAHVCVYAQRGREREREREWHPTRTHQEQCHQVYDRMPPTTLNCYRTNDWYLHIRLFLITKHYLHASHPFSRRLREQQQLRRAKHWAPVGLTTTHTRTNRIVLRFLLLLHLLLLPLTSTCLSPPITSH